MSQSALNANYQPSVKSLLEARVESTPSLKEHLSGYPNVLRCFVDLRTLLDINTAGRLMDELSVHCVSDTTIVRDLAGLLVREKADAALWSKFRSLLTNLVQEVKFVEETIVVFETVARTVDAAGCLEVAIPQLGKRKMAQKQRLAKAYVTAIQLQADPKVKDRLIATLPDGWLIGQLQRDESWEAYADLLLYSYAKSNFKDTKVAQTAAQDALWVAPHLLRQPESPYFARFVDLVQSLPSRFLNQQWKPHLAGLLAHNPANKALLTKLIELATKEEKRPLQEALVLVANGKLDAVRKCMTGYRETEIFTLPKNGDVPLSEQFQNALKSKNFTLALSILRKIPGPQWELWKQFFGCLPEKPDNALAEQAWTIWLEKHPLCDHMPEDEPYWKDAIQRVLGNVGEASEVLCDFITKQAEVYAIRLGKENSELLVGICLELGTAACWNKKATQPAAILRALVSLTSNKALEALHGPQVSLIKEHFQVHYYLLLANQADEDLYTIGNLWFLGRLVKTPLDTPLLKTFSFRPYLPRTIEDQIKVLEWVEQNLPAFHTEVSWIEKYLILSVLCRISFEKLEEGPRARYMLSIGMLWENLLWTAPQAISANRKYSDYLLSAARAFIDAAMTHIPNNKVRYKVLVSARQTFIDKVAPCVSEATAIAFRLHHCFKMFDLLPLGIEDEGGAVAHSLIDFNLAVVYMIQYSKTEIKDLVQRLTPSLRCLLNHPYPNICISLQVIFENLMVSPLFTKAKAPETPIFVSILQHLCLALVDVEVKQLPEAVKMVSQILRACTRSDQANKQLIDPAVDILGALFIQMPFSESLPDEDWKGLIQGLSNRSIKRITTLLRKEIKELSIDETFFSSTALACMICHANSKDKALLGELEELCQIGTGTHFKNLSQKCDLPLSLRLHSQWIRAISSLSKKCNTMGKQIDKALAARKIEMTVYLTNAVCKMIVDAESFRLYSPYLLDALTSDFNCEVTKLIHSLIPQSQVEELNQFKIGLETILRAV